MHRIASRPIKRLGRAVIVAALMILTVGTISACGQRGPLYLPNPDAANPNGKK